MESVACLIPWMRINQHDVQCQADGKSGMRQVSIHTMYMYAAILPQGIMPPR